MMSIKSMRGNWKGFVIGVFDKKNIIPGLFNYLTLSLLFLVLTSISSWVTSDQQFTVPIWLAVVGGFTIVFSLYSTLTHSLCSLIVYLILNAAMIGYFCFEMWETNSNTLGILFSFCCVAQLKGIEFWSLFWLELKENSQNVSSTSDQAMHRLEDEEVFDERLNNEEEEQI